jgi:hypothetical protein
MTGGILHPLKRVNTMSPRALRQAATEFPKGSVSVQWLSEFVRSHGGQLAHKTTAEVSEQHLKPNTKAKQCAYIRLAEERTADGHPSVGIATFFVSHAWQYKFLDLAEVIIEWGQTVPTPTYVWLDIFSVNQHAPEQPPEWWDSTFRTAVGELGHTLLVLAPWDKPVALSRVWCLWEILCTIDEGADLTVLLPSNEKRRLTEELAKDLDQVAITVADVDAERAEAFKAEDKKRIFEAIQRVLPKGFLDLNEKVKERLRQWTFYAGEEVGRTPIFLSHPGVNHVFTV